MPCMVFIKWRIGPSNRENTAPAELAASLTSKHTRLTLSSLYNAVLMLYTMELLVSHSMLEVQIAYPRQ